MATTKETRSLRSTIPHIIIIVALVLIFYHRFLSPTELQNTKYDTFFPDYPKAHLQVPIVTKDAITHYGQWPLWNLYSWGGSPYLGIPNKYIFYPFFLIFLWLPTAAAIINYSVLFHVILGGIGMFFLARYLFKDDRTGTIAALLWIASGYVFAPIFLGFVDYIYTIAWMPWLYLFVFKLTKEKEKTLYAVLIALVLSLQFYAGTIQFFVYDALLVFLILLYEVLIRALKAFDRTAKTMLVVYAVYLGLILLLTVLIIAPKLFPNQEFIAISSRAQPPQPDSWPGMFRVPKEMWQHLVTSPPWPGDISGHIGIIAFIAMLYTLRNLKDKRVLYFWLSIGFSLAMVSASPVYQVVQRLPAIKTGHYTIRWLTFYTIPAVILASIALTELLDKVKVRFTRDKAANRWLMLGALLVILLLQVSFQNFHIKDSENTEAVASSNEVLRFLQQKNEDEIFRIHNLAEGGIDRTFVHHYLPLGLESLYGHDGALWLPEYMNYFLGIQYRYNIPSKMLGIMNVKYIVSPQRVNVSGLEYVGRFNQCEACLPAGVDGPYLYENELYLPRAFHVTNAVLVTGDNAQQVSELMLVSPGFDPSSAVIITSPLLDDYQSNELQRFDAIVLTSMPQGNALSNLRQYQAQGGKIIPDIFAENPNTDLNQVLDFLASLEGGATEVRHERYTNNLRVLDTSPVSGFVVLSEKFYMFPKDWTSTAGKIYRANLGTSAVWVEPGTAQVSLRYFPASLKKGLVMLVFGVLLVAALLIWRKNIDAIFKRG